MVAEVERCAARAHRSWRAAPPRESDLPRDDSRSEHDQWPSADRVIRRDRANAVTVMDRHCRLAGGALAVDVAVCLDL